jgi:hypothetical protein
VSAELDGALRKWLDKMPARAALLAASGKSATGGGADDKKGKGKGKAQNGNSKAKKKR